MPKRIRHVILRLGNMLVTGPDTIHEAASVGNSYVEASTSLHLNNSSFTSFQSCRIYCDACGDDESGYLQPLARIATWDRDADMKITGLQWPNVDIRILEIELDCPALQNEIETLQKRMDANVLTSHGLPTRRNFGDAELGSQGVLRIETRAGWQRLSRQMWLGETPQFLDTFDSLCGVIENIGRPIDVANWVERHEHSPEILSTGKWWDWNYTPQPVGENAT
jgi:hypothetical protein